MCCSTPSPPHFGQAPNGLLNENSRGSISGMVKPDTGQANFSENTMRSVVSLRCLLALAPATGATSASSATAKPSASLSACSSKSAKRVAISGRTTRRSTTTSMSWVNFLSNAGTSAIS